MLLPLCGCGAASADHFKMARAGRDRIHRRAQPRWVGFQMAAAIGSTGTAHPFHPRPHHCPGPGLITARVPASSLPGLGLHRCRGPGLIAPWARVPSLPGLGPHRCRGRWGSVVAAVAGADDGPITGPSRVLASRGRWTAPPVGRTGIENG